MSKRWLDRSVLEAAQERVAFVLEHFERIYVSFSGGKDSSVMLHLVMEEAIKRGKTVGVLFVDLEGQYKITIEHIHEMVTLYKDNIELYWVCLPLALRNAVSVYEPKWECWEQGKDWIRQPPECAITDINYFPFFKVGMEFEEFVPKFGEWYGQEQLTACFVGIRADESLNRYRTIKSEKKSMFLNLQWTTFVQGGVYNIYPIYDWAVGDIWLYISRFNKCYNRLYDLMHQAGLTPSQMRICQPYGDDQRKGLWLFHVIEPETWGRVVARVNGANQGALYAKDSGNILGNQKIVLPEGHTWQSFAELILASLPDVTQEHFKDKIAVFLKWWQDRGYPNGIPDFADLKDEAAKTVPSWRRICKSLLRNDYWCKGLSFSQTKSESYTRYKKIMKNRRTRWNIYRPS